MEPIRICEIVTAVGGALWKGNPNAEVTSVSTNSRELEPGALFVPIVGEKVDAHRFIPMALDTGAVACFTQQEPEEGFKYLDGAVIRVGDTQKALQDFAAWYRKVVNAIPQACAAAVQVISPALHWRHISEKLSGSGLGGLPNRTPRARAAAIPSACR